MLQNLFTDTIFIYLQTSISKMDLRALRQDVQQLPNLVENVEKLQQCWIKPLRGNANNHLPFLQKLSSQIKKELNQKLLLFSETVAAVRYGATIQEKLRSYAHYLVELKLASLRDDEQKKSMITNRLLKDEFLNLSQTLVDVQEFSETVGIMEEQYSEINQLLERHLSLEEAVFFMGLPHRIYLATLVKTSRDHKRIARDLGKHFVEMAKSTPGGRRR